MKIYVVMQHEIESDLTCVCGVFTKLEDAQNFKNWYSEGDNERIFWIQERELFNKFDKELILAEQARNILK